MMLSTQTRAWSAQVRKRTEMSDLVEMTQPVKHLSSSLGTRAEVSRTLRKSDAVWHTPVVPVLLQEMGGKARSISGNWQATWPGVCSSELQRIYS